MRITSSVDPLNILLVEDNPGDALLIKEALRHSLPDAHHIEHANRLEAALTILGYKDFDVALLDRSLPDAEGFDGLHNLQAMAPHLPVVYLTANQDEDVAMDSIKQGAQDYLHKNNMDGHMIHRAMQYAILRKQFEGVLIARANYDMLTGLANRTLFESRLELAMARAKREATKLAVVFLDLDKFKAINDEYGHLVGDQLLKKFAARLKDSLRPYDTPARFGGDEFALLLENIADAEQAELVAEKIIHIMHEPFDLSGRKLKVEVSIGIALTDENMPPRASDIIKKADIAMYSAKSIGGSHIVFYSDAMMAQNNTKKMAI